MGEERAIYQSIDKDKKIRSEKNRLKKIYKEIDEQKYKTVEGLIEKAAYMRITLNDFEKDLDDKGYVEMFQQGRDQTPYERKRPVADLYNSMNGNYQKIIKQLTDLLPKEIKNDAKNAKEVDMFDEFIAGREDD